jgi:hypothetical protein
MTYFRNTTVNLVVIFAVLGTAISVQAATDDLEREFEVGAGGTLTLTSDSGAIEVETWDQDRVLVNVRNTDGYTIDFGQSGNDVVVTADSEGSNFFGLINFSGRSSVGFRVRVPVNYNVELGTGGGSIEVSDISGSVRADTSGGSIEVGNVSQGTVRADTSGGRITVGDVDGDVFADTSGGSITIGDVTGNAYADTSGGNIEIGAVLGDITADTSGGNIRVGEAGGEVELDTSGGTIRAAWAEGPISADTSGGNIFLAGSNTRVEADTSGGSIEIEASTGPVVADTSGGRIEIRNASASIHADTAGGSIDAELVNVEDGVDATVRLDTAGGDVTIRIPADHAASIRADLDVSRRARRDYRIYTDFPLIIREDDGDIVGEGDINGGGDRITLSTTNSDIHILSQ